LLEENGVDYHYRDYRKEPLSIDELERLFAQLRLAPADLLRKNDQANRELGLTGEESAETLIAQMAEHPTLLQRPIGVFGERAVLGRPIERLLDLGQE